MKVKIRRNPLHQEILNILRDYNGFCTEVNVVEKLGYKYTVREIKEALIDLMLRNYIDYNFKDFTIKLLGR